VSFADHHCKCDDKCTEQCASGDHKDCKCDHCDCGKGKECKKCARKAKAKAEAKPEAKTEAKKEAAAH
jgi:hypothetical protein